MVGPLSNESCSPVGQKFCHGVRLPDKYRALLMSWRQPVLLAGSWPSWQDWPQGQPRPHGWPRHTTQPTVSHSAVEAPDALAPRHGHRRAIMRRSSATTSGGRALSGTFWPGYKYRYNNKKKKSVCLTWRLFSFSFFLLVSTIVYHDSGGCLSSLKTHIDTLRPRQNCRQFAEFRFRWNLFFWAQLPKLIKIVVWRGTGDKQLSEPIMIKFTDAKVSHSASMD